jgi:hypothetical protein
MRRSPFIPYSYLRRFAIILVTVCALSGSISLAQKTTGLTITVPLNGTIVTPGQSLSIVVNTGTETYPSGVAIIGHDPIGGAAPVIGSPAQLRLTIPENIASGSYAITAVAANASGTVVSSPPVTIDVQRSDSPVSLSAPSPFELNFVGDSGSTSVTATFVGGVTLDLARSPQLGAISENPHVATMNGGVVTATGPGRTNIDLQFGSATAKFVVTVANSIRGDLNNDGEVDKDDLAIVTGSLNTPANGPDDARDLNHDGVINALDARILVTLCTHPNCAYQ